MKISIALGIGAPPRTAALLEQAGLRVVDPHAGGDAQADFSVSFAAALPDAAGCEQRCVVQCHGPDGRLRGAAMTVRGATQAASVVVSRIGDPVEVMMTGDGRTYDAFSRAIEAATRRLPLLVEGETGTGKKLLVRLFHAMSGRGMLLLVNGSLANVSRATSACAEGPAPGTIFLDNVDELSVQEQSAMLAAIRASAQERSSPPNTIVRYAAATRRPLEQMVRRGGFSPELYRELAGAAVCLPPLRERGGDIALLANYFLSRSGEGFTFSADALVLLAAYPFPGNVRELENLVRRLAIVPLAAGAREINDADVRRQIMIAARQKAHEPTANWRACLEAAEREIALRAIAACAGDYRAAARRLGMTLGMLRERVQVAESGRGGDPSRS